jgi:hypothetical protein
LVPFIDNTGPCECGYKHYLDGEEYDYVFQIPTYKGMKLIGYNMDGIVICQTYIHTILDNPFIIAQQFVIKHTLNENSLNDTPIISAIANSIIENTEKNTDKSYAERREEKAAASGFDPYKGL